MQNAKCEMQSENSERDKARFQGLKVELSFDPVLSFHIVNMCI